MSGGSSAADHEIAAAAAKATLDGIAGKRFDYQLNLANTPDSECWASSFQFTLC